MKTSPPSSLPRKAWGALGDRGLLPPRQYPICSSGNRRCSRWRLAPQGKGFSEQSGFRLGGQTSEVRMGCFLWGTWQLVVEGTPRTGGSNVLTANTWLRCLFPKHSPPACPGCRDESAPSDRSGLQPRQWPWHLPAPPPHAPRALLSQTCELPKRWWTQQPGPLPTKPSSPLSSAALPITRAHHRAAGSRFIWEVVKVSRACLVPHSD